jgi:hypothetical protein
MVTTAEVGTPPSSTCSQLNGTSTEEVPVLVANGAHDMMVHSDHSYLMSRRMRGSGSSRRRAGALGLTNGVFYARFESKEDLVATAISDQLDVQQRTFSELSGNRARVDEFRRGRRSSARRRRDV